MGVNGDAAATQMSLVKVQIASQKTCLWWKPRVWHLFDMVTIRGNRTGNRQPVRASIALRGANQKCEPQCELRVGMHRRARTDGAYHRHTVRTYEVRALQVRDKSARSTPAGPWRQPSMIVSAKGSNTPVSTGNRSPVVVTAHGHHSGYLRRINRTEDADMDTGFGRAV